MIATNRLVAGTGEHVLIILHADGMWQEGYMELPSGPWMQASEKALEDVKAPRTSSRPGRYVCGPVGATRDLPSAKEEDLGSSDHTSLLHGLL